MRSLPARFAAPSRPDTDTAADPLARARHLLQRPAAPPAAAPRTPPDPGPVLAELPRDDGSTLLVAVQRATSTGAPYLHVGVWRNGWPEKGRSVAVRVRELLPVLAALADAVEHVDELRAARAEVTP